MAKVLYDRDGRIARITLNRADVLNAIDDELPVELAEAVARADGDDAVHVIVLSGPAARSARATILHIMPRLPERIRAYRICHGTP